MLATCFTKPAQSYAVHLVQNLGRYNATGWPAGARILGRRTVGPLPRYRPRVLLSFLHPTRLFAHQLAGIEGPLPTRQRVGGSGMFAGHASMGLALVAVARDTRRRAVGLLVGASLVADVGWCALTLAGIEGGHSMGSQALHSPRLPWSHSVLSTGVLALAMGTAGEVLARPRNRARLAALAALAVWIHLLLGDVPFGEAFPLAPWTEPLPTPHLYASWPAAFVVETLVIAGGVAVVAARGWGWRRGRLILALLLALHVVAWAPTFAERPAVDLDATRLAILGYLALLLMAWLACIVVAPVGTPSAPHSSRLEG
jgi:hypothetical protein